MSYKIIRDANNRHQTGREIVAVLDTDEDLAALGNAYAPGSQAIVTQQGGNTYMMNASGEWVKLDDGGSTSGSGSGLPAGSKPNQYIVTDGEGNAKWEDKLCWSEEGKVVLPETFLAEPVGQQGSLYAYNVNFTFEVQKKYTVIYNGVAYDVIFQYSGGVYGAGNLSLLGVGADTGEPFLVIYGAQDGSAMIGTLDGGGITIAIYEGEVEAIHKLSGKYVEGMGWSEPGVKELLAETSFTEDMFEADYGGVFVTFEMSALTIGNKYAVKFNSVVYDLECFIDNGRDGAPTIGAPRDDWSSYPFAIFTYEDVAILAVQKAGTYTVSVSGEGETVHPIDKKYLMGSNLRVFITVDDNDEYVASHTYEEIKNHVLSGGTCDCVMGSYIMCLTEATFMHGVQPFMSASQAMFMSIGNGYVVNSVAIEADGPVYVRQIQLSFEDV